MADIHGSNVAKLGEDLPWVERINTGFGEIMLTMRVYSEGEVGGWSVGGHRESRQKKIKPVFPGWRKAEPEKSSYLLVFVAKGQ